MKPYKCIKQLLFLACLLTACSGEDEERPSTEVADVRFTASVSGQTKADAGDGTTLTDKGRVVVYAWEGNSPSETDKYAYSNRYTFNSINAGGYELSSLGSNMQLPLGKTYAFYALSSNHAEEAAPAISSVSYNRTETLKNGVDYLLAVTTGHTISSSNDATVSLDFRHIATRVVLTIQPGATEGYTSAGSLSVAIAPIDSTGSYIDLSAAWDANNPKDMIYWGTSSPAIIGGMALGQANGQQQFADKNNNTFTIAFILLPVAENQSIPLQLEFTDIEFATGGVQAKKVYTTVLNVPPGGLKGGYTNKYTANISRNSATFNSLPQVEPWVVDGIDLDEVIEVDPKN